MNDTRLAELRAEISRIEGRTAAFEGAPDAVPRPWTFGVEALDRALAGGLAADGLHEITPSRYGDSWAALGFALALTRRRAATDDRPLLWCRTARKASEFGYPAGEGLRRFGLDPGRLILILAANTAEAAFVIEEALRCGRLAAVLAQTDGFDATAQRRLSLAAKEGATPALLAGAPQDAGIPTATSRWRIALPPPRSRQPPGTPPRLDGLAWRAELLRNRHGPAGSVWPLTFLLADPDREVSDEQAFRFHLSAAAADRESAAA